MTPGYDGQVVGRDCNCEDFPCCGHGITMREAFEENRYLDFDDEDREDYEDER